MVNNDLLERHTDTEIDPGKIAVNKGILSGVVGVNCWRRQKNVGFCVMPPAAAMFRESKTSETSMSETDERDGQCRDIHSRIHISTSRPVKKGR